MSTVAATEEQLMVDSRRAPTGPDSMNFTCESSGMVIGELRGRSELMLGGGDGGVESEKREW